MGPLGADPEALHELAATLRTASARLDDIAVGLDRRSRATGWRGPDAERFAREWHGQHRPSLRTLGDNCSRLAITLRSQAEQQTRASAAGALALVPPTPARGAGRTLTETTYTGGLEPTVASVNGIIRGDVSIRELGGGRTRVTVSESALVGAVASAGARLDFSIGDELGTVTPTAGARAEGKARGGATLRRSWEVDEDEVGGLLARIAADQALTVSGDTGRLEDPLRKRSIGGDPTGSLARWFGGMIDDGVELLTGVDPGADVVADRLVTIPAAERFEGLIALEAIGGAGAAAGSATSRAAPAAYASLAGEVRVGYAGWQGGRSLIVENRFEGTAGASVGLLGRLGVGLPDNLHAASEVRFELAQRSDRTLDHVVVEVATTIGREQTESRVEIDLTGEFGRDAAEAFGRLVDRAASLDPDGTVAAFASLATVDLPLEEITVSSTTAEVSGTTSRIGGSVGNGLTVGVAGHGRVVRVERAA